MNLNGKIPGNGSNILTAIGGFGHSEKPTISYKPLEGKQFVNRVLEETKINTFLLLIRAGWNIERVARILTDSVGELSSYPKHPSYPKFLELIQLWEQMSDQGDLIFTQLPGQTRILADSIPKSQVDIEHLVSVAQAGYSLKPYQNGLYQLTKRGKPTLAMKMTYKSQAEADRVDTLLDIRPQRTVTPDGRIVEYIQFIDPLVDVDPEPGSNRRVAKVPLVLRSFSNQLFGLSRSIQMPEKDKAMIKTYVNAQNQTVDVRTAYTDLIDIRSDSSRPGNALVSVQYLKKHVL